MEDDNGLELSLGLPCGGSSANSKSKNGNSSDTRTDEGEKGNKLIDDFKNFLHGGTQKQDSGMRSQTSDPVKPEENFFNNLSKAATNVDTSNLNNGGGLWVSNETRSAEVEEEKRMEGGSKRKSLFDEINHQKKREREAHHADLHDKTRTSHISITTDEGSTADNEDVADSEAEGSTSRLVPHHDDGSKRNTGCGGGSLYEGSKEVHGVSDSNGIDLQGQKRFNISSEKEFKFGNVSYGVPFPPQSVNIMNMPYSLPMQVMASANSERPGSQPVMPANLPLMFGYSPVQLPTLDKDNSRGLISHSQQLHQSYFGRGPPNMDKQNDGLKISQEGTSSAADMDPGEKVIDLDLMESQFIDLQRNAAKAWKVPKESKRRKRLNKAPEPSVAQPISGVSPALGTSSTTFGTLSSVLLALRTDPLLPTSKDAPVLLSQNSGEGSLDPVLHERGDLTPRGSPALSREGVNLPVFGPDTSPLLARPPYRIPPYGVRLSGDKNSIWFKQDAAVAKMNEVIYAPDIIHLQGHNLVELKDIHLHLLAKAAEVATVMTDMAAGELSSQAAELEKDAYDRGVKSMTLELEREKKVASTATSLHQDSLQKLETLTLNNQCLRTELDLSQNELRVSNSHCLIWEEKLKASSDEAADLKKQLAEADEKMLALQNQMEVDRGAAVAQARIDAVSAFKSSAEYFTLNNLAFLKGYKGHKKRVLRHYPHLETEVQGWIPFDAEGRQIAAEVDGEMAEARLWATRSPSPSLEETGSVSGDEDDDDEDV